MSAQKLLHYKQVGEGEPLVILHGLFGSSKNWQTLAKQLGEFFKVYSVDLRNHGASFHDADMSYRLMAQDVYRLLEHLDIPHCRIIGHSMGGKVAMILSLLQPDSISKMVVADIAPVVYQHHHTQLLAPIMALNLADYSSRAAIDNALKIDINEPALRSFLLHNLARDEAGCGWRWNVNWSAIQQHMEVLTGFENLGDSWMVDIPTLFIRGQMSDYVGKKETEIIDRHFSRAHLQTVAQAGHWLHAERPHEFFDRVVSFLH